MLIISFHSFFWTFNPCFSNDAHSSDIANKVPQLQKEILLKNSSRRIFFLLDIVIHDDDDA
jgi:hypothetical protein